MKLSQKASYALRALFDMAFHSGGGSSKVDTIAQREEIPPRFLEQIFQDLKAAGIIGSKRGRAGGYFLRKAPHSVTFGDVIRAVEGQFQSPCSATTDAEMLAQCDITSRCVPSAMWRDVTHEIDRLLDRYTIADMCAKARAVGLEPAEHDPLNYQI